MARQSDLWFHSLLALDVAHHRIAGQLQADSAERSAILDAALAYWYGFHTARLLLGQPESPLPTLRLCRACWGTLHEVSCGQNSPVFTQLLFGFRLEESAGDCLVRHARSASSSGEEGEHGPVE